LLDQNEFRLFCWWCPHFTSVKQESVSFSQEAWSAPRRSQIRRTSRQPTKGYEMKTSRRKFIKVAGLAGGSLMVPWNFTIPSVRAAFLVPQSPLAGKFIPKYVDPMPNFAGARVDGTMPITVSVEEISQQVLPAAFPATTVWAYRVGPRPPFYPGYTIEAFRGTPTMVTYENNLSLLPALEESITVDQTIHWANPLGLPMHDPQRRQPYQGPPPIAIHLHGGEVPSDVDGGPDSWFTPGFGIVGPGYTGNVYNYPNSQEATTLWFHDHVLGETRLNVYRGLAGFYLLRDLDSIDTGIPMPGGLPAGAYEMGIVFQDRQFDTTGQLLFPDGYPGGLNGDPPNPDIHPFWIPEFFGDVMVVNGKAWPYLEVEPRRYRFRFLNGCNSRFLLLNFVGHGSGPKLWQIGTDGGLLNAPVLLNKGLFLAPGERADVIIDFAQFYGQTFTVRNSAKAPYPKGSPPDPQTNGQVMQFRVVIPLSSQDDSYNPANGGSLRPSNPIIILNPAVTGRAADQKRQLTLVEVEEEGGPIEVLVNNTKWSGIEEGSMPPTPVPGSIPDGHGNYLTEFPRVGSTEVWEIINLTGDAHPIHLHLVQFQILNRQAFNADRYEKYYESLFPGGTFGGEDYEPGEFIPGYGPPQYYLTPNGAGAIGGNPDVTPYLQGPVMAPDPEELGWKDTFKMYPGQVTRVVVRWAPLDVAVADVSPGMNLYPFDPTEGPGYVWHCHIIDHEDNEMMRPYAVVS
jgi:spore coat protein A